MNSEPPGIFANGQALQHALADRELVGASGIPAPVKAGADKTLAKKAPAGGHMARPSDSPWCTTADDTFPPMRAPHCRDWLAAGLPDGAMGFL